MACEEPDPLVCQLDLKISNIKILKTELRLLFKRMDNRKVIFIQMIAKLDL